jgi:disulfide bond formation protein DsbB
VTRVHLSLVAAGGSAALLLGAFAFQMVGYAPCEMCLWQRWPHVAAVLIGALAVVLGARVWPSLGALAAITTGMIGVYHAGVEQGFWPGPSSCTGGGGLSGDLLSLDGPTLIMCDQITWTFAGFSMAAWNAVISLILALIWLRAATRL